MISSQTPAQLLLHFHQQPGVWKEKGTLVGRSWCGWTYSWGDLASARVGIASSAAGHLKLRWKLGEETGLAGWGGVSHSSSFCSAPSPSYTRLCLEAFPGNLICFCFDLAFKCSQSGNASCPMKARPLHILRAQTEHFHGRNERVFSVTTRADFMSLLRWPFPLPWGSCWGLTCREILSVLLRAPAARGLLQSDSSGAVMLHTEWCGCLWSAVPPKDSCQRRGKCPDPVFELSLHGDRIKFPSGPLCKCTPRGIPAIEWDQPCLLHWSPHSPALTRELRGPWSCVTSTGKPQTVAKRQSKLLCCLWCLWVRKTVRNRPHLKKVL